MKSQREQTEKRVKKKRYYKEQEIKREVMGVGERKEKQDRGKRAVLSDKG